MIPLCAIIKLTAPKEAIQKEFEAEFDGREFFFNRDHKGFCIFKASRDLRLSQGA